jgi:CRISPR-associated protein Cas2
MVVMYVILVYDVNSKRCGKMLKLCRRYLHWVQNSVLEGDISPVKLKELEYKAGMIMDKDEDSLLIFCSRSQAYMEKRRIGTEKNNTGNYL